MINEKQLLAAAESAAGGAVLEWLEARHQVPGNILSQRGLLAATRDALVFVVDDLLRAGPTTVWRRKDLRSYQLRSELFTATLTLQVGEAEVQFTDLRPEQTAVLMATCGLTSPTPSPPPRTTVPSELHLATPVEYSSARTSQLETHAPDGPAQTPLTFATAIVPPDPDKKVVASNEGITSLHEESVQVDDDDSDDELDDDDSDDDSDDDASDDDDAVNGDESEEGDRNGATQAENKRAAPELVRARLLSVLAKRQSDPRTPVESQAVETPPSPPVKSDPEAVSGSIGLAMMILLIAAVALPVLIGNDLKQTILGIRPHLILAAIGSARETLTIGFYLAVAVTVVGAPGNALGCRPTVFWTTLPMFFALIAVVTGIQSVFPDPKHPTATAETATELLIRLRHAQTMPYLVMLLAAYVYGLPLLGVWFRALATNPRHRKEDRRDSMVEAGDSQPALLMLGAAVVIPFASCLYVQRSGHASWAILIALAFVAPSAILSWQGSRLDSRIRWDLGGSPAAFAIQGAFVYALYWMLVRQRGILPHIDAAIEQSEQALLHGELLDTLQRVLGHSDVALLKGLALSQIGVIIASWIGHRAIVKIDPNQKCSVAGWLFALALGLILLLMAWAMEMDFHVRIPAFIEQLKDAAQHRASNG